MSETRHPPVVILDFGSQYTRLIARRFREAGAYSVVLAGGASAGEVAALQPAALVLSGGPASVYDQGAPRAAPGVLELGLPTLGICYGMHLVAQRAGGAVEPGTVREYGPARIESFTGELFEGVRAPFDCWMSHGDSVAGPPPGFDVLAGTIDTPVAAIVARGAPVFGIQFHPEVVHTPQGGRILDNFLRLAGVPTDWRPREILDDLVAQVRERVGHEGRVVLGLSGGVDSSTLALLLARAVGERHTAIFVDHGLLRDREAEEVETALGAAGVRVRRVDAQERFLEALRGVSDPEEKRRIIGREFIRVFEAEARALEPPHQFLAQGTLYPDVIESAGASGAARIKSHHNVGGLPEDLALDLLEPFRYLFKDEVREIAGLLGLPPEIRGRHPFPGPGLAVRVLGEVTPERLEVLRRVDRIFIDELRASGEYDRIWQAFAVLLPVKAVGVMGDGRTYQSVVSLRAVTSVDGMTADWARLPPDLLGRVSTRIVNSVAEVNRVVYDVTSKPPGTIEWE